MSLASALADAVRDHARRLTAEDTEDAYCLEHARLSDTEIAAAQGRLGFRLPPDLSELYREVGNGGYGPSYGLLGLVNGALQEEGCDAVALYESFRHMDPDDPHWQWPKKLLPVVALGCAMYFCVDCSDDNGMVVWFEPNGHEFGTSWAPAFVPLGRTFGHLMRGWANGEDVSTVLESAGLDARELSEPDASPTIECAEHGQCASAIVCRHHINVRDRAMGFFENSSEPDDLQAWCDECEACFEREGEMTEAFRAFNGMAVVCIHCYLRLKREHSRRAM